ncbi:MAG: Maf family protein [Lachnospiraceae bacterium]|nr:Maf family protein [Lachnospiraceae bacterium]
MIILASASPRRKEILEQMGLEFTIKTSDAPEFTDKTDPGEMVMDLSRMKAEAVYRAVCNEGILPQNTTNIIIAADTLVFADGKVLGKPRDRKEAFDMLNLLQGRSHEVRTGVTLVYITKEAHQVSFQDVTEVTFAPMSDKEINALIDTGEPMDKAGAYGIQGYTAKFITGIKGDYYNVMGLPAAKLYATMKEHHLIEEV